ncbi:ATP-binding protein [Paralysiella testudinis]|uniref:ATP-binding protein n=1 Tax=Paralysiella testudinis TaxID=2809020 RepID=A0A892ZI75_9NEIS|nr:ATP-binding protein [Paralysiella testudinis]QRQ81234.1 ATP-binding protein [Paralysiella testudinis]
MHYSLQNIILHHSYFRHKRVKIPCFGHTNNTGDNGAGKTSALQLIPVFYGYPPESFMSRAAGKDSFLDYYLPHTHSMIVFEYQRPGGMCCAILYRHPHSPKLIYRFASGAADQTLFTDNTADHFSQNGTTADLFKLLEKQEIYVSGQIGTISDYAAVLGNTQARLRRSQDKRLSIYARDFSLCPAGTQMQHIGELTGVLLNTGQLLNQLRRMLATTLMATISINKKPLHDKNSRLPETIRSLHLLTQEKTKLEQGVIEAKAMRNTLNDLAVQRHQAYRLSSRIQTEENRLNAEKEQLKEQNQTLESLFTQQLSIFAEEKATQEGCLKSTQKQLKMLNKQQENYRRDNMAGQERELANLSQYEDEYQAAYRFYNTLHESERLIIENFQRNCREVEQQAGKQKNALLQQQKSEQQKFRQTQTRLQEALEKLRQQERQEEGCLKAQHQQEAMVLIQARSDTKAAIGPAVLPTPEEAEELSDYNNQINQAETQQHHAARAAATAEQQHRQAEQSHKTAVAVCEETEGHIRRLDQEQQKLREILFGEGNLLSFLRQSGTDWHQDIAKIINPDLLLHKSLQPQWHANQHNFYGLSIDTRQLALPAEAADEATQQQRWNRLQEKMGLLQRQLTEQQNTAAALFQAAANAQTAWTQKTIAASRAEQHTLSLKQALNQAKIRHVQTANERRQAAEETAQQAETDLEQQQQQHQQAQADLQHKFFIKQQQFQAQITQTKDEFDAILVDFDERNAAIEQHTEAQIAALSHSRDRALATEGVDPKTLKQAEQKLQAVETKIERIKKTRESVYRYQQWLANEWPQHNHLIEEAEAQEIALAHLQSQIENLRNQHTQAQRQITQKQQILNQKAARHSQQQDMLKTLLHKLNDTLSTDLTDETSKNTEQTELDKLPFDAFTATVQNSLVRQQEQEKTLKQAVLAANTALQHGDLAQAWQDRMAAYHHFPFGTLPYNLAAMDQIAEMLQYDIPQTISSNIQTFRSVADGIHNYYQDLQNFNHQVQRLSKRLSAQINAEHGFPALSDIQIRLTSAIEDESLYNGLKIFAHKWEDESEPNRLPEDKMLEAFTNALHILEHSNINTEQTASLIHLEISCKEQGRPFVLSHHTNLKKSSSEGISTLLTVVLFASLTRYLCPDPDTVIHWPLDELGRLSSGNIRLLFEFMDKQHIRLFCAQPELNALLSNLFVCKNDIDRNIGVVHYQAAKRSANPLLEHPQ